MQMQFCETSARTAVGVNEMIEKMLTDIIQKGTADCAKGTTKLSSKQGPKEKDDGCC